MKPSETFIRISFRREDFRMSIGRPFCIVMVGALVLSECWFAIQGQNESLQTFLLSIPLATAALGALFLLLLSLKYHLVIGPDGIDNYNYRWQPQRTPWQEISDARFFSLFGLEYLLVNTAERRRPIWIPLFVHRYDRFRDLMVTYADATHELDDKLEETC